MKNFVVVGVTLICMISVGYAQNSQPPEPPSDSATVLEEVMVRAFEANKKLIDVPAAITVIGKSQLTRFNNTSLVSALNTAAGVRMEERSPGSYRLNIRGSSLRSPFGVRNVKVYYNGIPYTDPGGNTYLNQLGFYNVTSMELLKEPGSSLYGAGTGGVLLLSSDQVPFRRGATVDYTGSSYGGNSFHANIRGGTPIFNSSMRIQYQNNDGYRDQTKMERRVVSSDMEAKVGKKGVLRAHFMQGDLFYETPGALTAAEFLANPKAARPRVGQTPGAEEAQAAISQKLFMGGLSYVSVWDEHWQNSVALYAAYSRLNNPTTRNYERRTEPHYGSRGKLQYTTLLGKTKFTWIGGIEAQQGFTTSRVYTNVQGNADSLTTDDEVTNKAASVFTQGVFELASGWSFTGGLSYNLFGVRLQRFSRPQSYQEKEYNNQAAPRVAVLKKINPRLSVYGSVAKGFSPPTTAEILPSTGVITADLEPETGWNTELGLKGNFFRNRLFLDLSLFYFGLKNTIVQRRDASGGDYFVNAGNTRQNGVETYLSYNFLERPTGAFYSVKAWASHTWHNFHYRNYIKVGDDLNDYSGNRLPSIPEHFFVAGVDAMTTPGFYGNITYYYSDKIPLNDANTAFASSYNLLNARVGFKKALRSNINLDLYLSADNIFDVTYSLGNDINALGGRYYNAAPGANFAAGISVFYGW